MGVDMRWIRTGTGVQAAVLAKKPIKGELIVDPMDSKVVIKYDPPTESVQLLAAKLFPGHYFLIAPMALEHAPQKLDKIDIVNIFSRENVRNVVVEVNKSITFNSLYFLVALACIAYFVRHLPKPIMRCIR